ncbi:unnamed protein product [Blepharisma stoltei]|uniref:Secreted protein n=1 Tax=Blepharisma stoltei TaxID=1481888 RepID=A0AAU9J161_9CILI|nr:unnamed protein product [Blepharisma stoltei]
MMPLSKSCSTNWALARLGRVVKSKPILACIAISMCSCWAGCTISNWAQAFRWSRILAKPGLISIANLWIRSWAHFTIFNCTCSSAMSRH